MRKSDVGLRSVASVAILSLLWPSVGAVVVAQGKPAAAPDPAASVDGGWPRAYQTAAAAGLVVYQPQIASWDGRAHMVAYAAVSYQVKGASKPSLGTVRLEANTSVWVDDRLVRFSPVKVTETSFGELPREQLQDIVTQIDSGIPEHDRLIALDRVLANLDKSQIIPKNLDGINADPPTIFYSTRSAILVSLDGDPIWSPIANSELKFAVNTNWDLFSYEPTKTYFLRNERAWLKATDVKGPWTTTTSLPDSFKKLPADDNWKDVRAALSPSATAATPQVYVSTKPAELIRITGAPTYVPVAGTKLLWVSNTESDVFRLGQSGSVYYLVAGRWFSAAGFNGPWTFATPNLPADFKKISLEHPRSRVLASVPGTPQAIEAVLLAQVPQTARVNKKELKGPDVVYQGAPDFQPIPETTVSRAVNTDRDIIKVGDLYYMCFQGVWFQSRSPNGPWEVASSVPGAIYEIPASSPAHNVTYVTVVEDDDDEWVTFAAVAGYTGLMIGWGCAVWGTGWYYPPYVWYGGFYPMYYPFYPTYGFGAWYNPWTGVYGRGAAWYGPYGGAGVAARYNPVTRTYARGAAAWGPYGSRGVAAAYNPRTGAYARTAQGSGVYGSWGTTSVQRGNQWAQTARVTNRATGTTTRATRGSGGGEAITRSGPSGTGGVARTGSGDVYAGRDGNVYRNNGSGWQKWDNGSWNSANRPTPQNRATPSTGQNRATPSTGDRSDPTANQLDRDRAARREGQSRTRDFGNARSSGATRSGGSYRPSGGARAGGARAGGGRRR
jgi:hypothetical protein